MRSGAHWPSLIYCGNDSGSGPGSICTSAPFSATRAGTVLHHKLTCAVPSDPTVMLGTRRTLPIGATSNINCWSYGNTSAAWEKEAMMEVSNASANPARSRRRAGADLIIEVFLIGAADGGAPTCKLRLMIVKRLPHTSGTNAPHML